MKIQTKTEKFGVSIMVEYLKNGKLVNENLTLPFFQDTTKKGYKEDKKLSKLVMNKLNKIIKEIIKEDLVRNAKC